MLDQIKAGRLLDAYEEKPVPASIIYPSARHQSPNVRSFVRFAQPRIRERLQKLRRD
ncbi:MAG: hypothetical protein K2X06_11540 [Burkholderiales bacterium]|nr:hypothetical protein [Burkholderiales bacterium]